MKSTLENRGVSFSAGGDPGSTTLANLIRVFRHDLKGASIGDHLAELCYYDRCLPMQYHPELDQLNAAQSGATVLTLDHEIDYLLDQLRDMEGIDYAQDFKLITLFIGNNDVCLGCSPFGFDRSLTPDAFEVNMRSVLERLRTNIPRVIVNVLLQFNVSQVWDLTHNDKECQLLRASGMVFECVCAFLPGPLGAHTRTKMDQLAQLYNERLLKIAKDYAFTDDPSFMMIIDPILSNVEISKWGIEYLSRTDCFHPDVAVHELMAVGVWNNLFAMGHRKKQRIDPGETLLPCPISYSQSQQASAIAQAAQSTMYLDFTMQ
eukprot:jgi/Hompol1/694/HPOL_004602-RA